jgi:transcriptional regulator with XRE-family HTH domain
MRPVPYPANINGAELERLIREAGISNSELGRRLGAKGEGRQVRRWISGEVTPGTTTLFKIAEALGMSPGDLINRLFDRAEEELRGDP